MPSKQNWWMRDAKDIAEDKDLATPLLGLPTFGKPEEKNDDDYLYGSSSEEEEEEEEEEEDEEAAKEARKKARRENKTENDDEDDDSENSDDSDEEENEQPKLGLRFYIVSAIGASAMLFNVGSLYLAYTGAILLVAPTTVAALSAGTVGAALAPIVIYRESKITEITSTRDGINQVRGQVNMLQKQNKRLAKSRRNMGKQLKRLKDCEEKLQDTVERNGASVDEFVEVVEENQKIMTKMKGHFDAKIIQDCVKIIIKYDKDQDFILSSRELPMLIYALKSFDINIPDEAAFKAALTDRSVSVAIDHVTQLIEQTALEEAKRDKYGLSKPGAMEKYRNIPED